MPVKVPNLEKAGYTLAGITAYPDRDGHVTLDALVDLFRVHRRIVIEGWSTLILRAGQTV